MPNAYDQLSTEEQISLGAEFQAMDTPLPEGLRSILLVKGLLDLVLHPEERFGDNEIRDT